MSVRQFASAAPATIVLASAGALLGGPAPTPSVAASWTTNTPAAKTGPAKKAQPPACPHIKPRLRCPDLVMSAPYHFHLDRTTRQGHLLLRAASSINDVGSGPMELSFHRNGSHITAYQAIYDIHGGRHLFVSRARLTFKYVPGERYGLSAIEAFSYWKLKHAAAFQLWSIDAHDRALKLVRTGPKVDYCLRDLFRTHPSRASPTQAVYPACSQDPYMKRDLLGTSVGWSDQYPYEYPEQWIDVTGLRGRFAYVQIVDPDDLLIESNHKNDVSETYVALPSGRVLGHRVGVAAP
ncbi:MAG TPA: lysyl oxidase family protein [Solirubrobacteraceae bacterium]|nr:lysyl oxidase family protein [Solirubrobacteraceae bacterium]